MSEVRTPPPKKLSRIQRAILTVRATNAVIALPFDRLADANKAGGIGVVGCCYCVVHAGHRFPYVQNTAARVSNSIPIIVALANGILYLLRSCRSWESLSPH